MPVEFKGENNWQEVNILVLAYLGDAVYELWARTHLLENRMEKVQEIHRQAVFLVRAKTQAEILRALMPELEDAEVDVVMRGRNTKGYHPRNVEVQTYRHATAFEALIGYLYITGNQARLNEIFTKITGIINDIKAVNSEVGLNP